MPLSISENTRHFILLSLLFMIVNYTFQFLLVDKNLYIEHLMNQVSYERAMIILSFLKSYDWVGYAITPFAHLIKLSLITTCLGLGFFFSTNHFNFKAFFNVAVFAELIFLFPIIIKLLWFLFVKTDYDLNDLTLFYPLSALNLFDTETLPRYWLAPLQTLNLFEVAYWFLLAYGVADATDFSFKRSFGLVMSSYGVGLVLWVVLVMFLTITYS